MKRAKRNTHKTKNRTFHRKSKQRVEPSDSNLVTSVPREEEAIKCKECKEEKASFRPLVDVNGAFLCDSCYVGLFPATAMVEENEANEGFFSLKKRRRKGKEGNENNFPEEEECRLCLDHGEFRRCCGNYYCRSCFHRGRSCPGCGEPIHRSGVTQNEPKPGKTAVIFSWGISISFILIIFGIVSLILTSYYTAPETIWGRQCLGLFPRCDNEVCIDLGSDEPVNGMPTEYSFCSTNVTANKIVGGTCVFDKELYRWSNKTLGYDICVDDFDYGITGTEGFKKGTYIFEDNFDYWYNSTFEPSTIHMASSKWLNINNGMASDICGFSNRTRKYEWQPDDTKPLNRTQSSLVFSGVRFRNAETKDLDMRYGGLIFFAIKFAPIVDNELSTSCKPAYGGDVTLSYSVDDGKSWETIASYPVWKYRKPYFSTLEEVIPKSAERQNVRFKWNQPVFDTKRDFWALDDVQILHFFEKSWQDDDIYEVKKRVNWNLIQHEQCCYDTEQCLDFPNDKRVDCHFDQYHDTSFRLKAVDYFILLALVICIGRNWLSDIFTWCNSKEIQEIKKRPSMSLKTKSYKRTIFSVQTSSSWQILSFSILSFPFIVGIFFLGGIINASLEHYQNSSVSTILSLIAVSLDFTTLKGVATDVLHFWPCHTIPRIEIDTSNESFSLYVGKYISSSMDITRFEYVSKQMYLILFGSVFISTCPLSIWCILLKSLKLDYLTYQYILHTIGSCALVRSLLGPLWFTEVCYSLSWICFTFTSEGRDAMGRSMKRPAVRHVLTNSIISCLVVCLPIMIFMARTRQFSTLLIILMTLSILLFGALLGSVISLVRGLPISLDINLTVWPTHGFSFVNQQNDCYPNQLPYYICGKMNTCKLCILFLEDMGNFKKLLSGSEDISTNNVQVPGKRIS